MSNSTGKGEAGNDIILNDPVVAVGSARLWLDKGSITDLGPGLHGVRPQLRMIHRRRAPVARD